MPRTRMRRLRSVSEKLLAVSASDRSGRSTRPARASPTSEAMMIVANWVTAWVRTAVSISLRSKAGKFATTNRPCWLPRSSGTAT